MGKISNRGRTDTKKGLVRQGATVGDRNEQREQKRAEESQEQATEFLKEIEDVQFDYSELPLQELEEELQMYNEDIKKLKRAIADKKKGSETSKQMKPKRKVGVEKILDAEYEKLKGLNKLT